jgi:hypothetical protein
MLKQVHDISDDYKALAYKHTNKFEIGNDVVTKKPTLYNETEGTITEVTRMFKAVCPYTGKIDRAGLCILEQEIVSMSVPYELDGDVLKVHMPERDYGTWVQKAQTHVYVFNGFCYTVKTPKMNTVYSEKTLKLKK